MDNQEPNRKRRVRYSGTHPKTFKEKYKELNPDQYAEDINKVMSQGRTPAGMHRSICVQEILDFLDIKEGQTGLDATLGYGGHSLEMLKKLGPTGKLFAVDVDPIELPKTRERLAKAGFGPEVLSIHQMNFSKVDKLSEEFGLFDFVLADLGVSSMQIDNPERGFTFKVDGPLDLRLNPNKGIPVSLLLNQISMKDLQELLEENADEPNAAFLAKRISDEIKGGSEIKSTFQLKKIIEDCFENIVGSDKNELIKKTCQRVFQALRIHVNQEFDVLEQFLRLLPYILNTHGKVAILTFHSGEDRRVKKAFQTYYRSGVFKEIANEPIRPSAQECHSNPRAKSAKLRWAILNEAI